MKLTETNILQLKAGEKEKVFSPEELFGNDFPLELEIGCGKGKFLVGRAQESPDRNFIGVDRVGKWMKIGDTRGSKRNLKNLLFVKADAPEFLKTVKPQSVEVIHMYFPDPWPKRRHRGRRLFTADFVKVLYGKLKSGGLLELATDFQDYYEQMQKSVKTADLPWKTQRETVGERIHSPHLKTNYELKFEAAGKNLYYMELRK